MLLLGFALILVAISPAVMTDRQPNILWIVADDLGYTDVSYHGAEFQTPNLDALALGGVQLENYYVQMVDPHILCMNLKCNNGALFVVPK